MPKKVHWILVIFSVVITLFVGWFIEMIDGGQAVWNLFLFVGIYYIVLLNYYHNTK